MRTCDACGREVVGGYVLDGAMICCDCDVRVRAEMCHLRNNREKVDVKAIAGKLLSARQSMSKATMLIEMSLLCKKWRKNEESQGLNDAADELFDLIVRAQKVRNR